VRGFRDRSAGETLIEDSVAERVEFERSSDFLSRQYSTLKSQFDYILSTNTTATQRDR
jgi:transcriptional regulator CtsR